MISAFNLPITYMLFVDEWGYARHGVSGSFAADAAVSLLACILLVMLLTWLARRRPAPLPARAYTDASA